MLNVTQFLEALGRNPGPLSDEELAAVVAASNFSLPLKKALHERDADAVNRLLGGRTRMICSIAPAENDEPSETEEEQRDDDADAPETPATGRAA
jgi:hypothetical protein